MAPQTAAHQASLSFAISQSLLKLMSYLFILCQEYGSEILGLKTTEAQYFKEVEYKIFTLNSLNFCLSQEKTEEKLFAIHFGFYDVVTPG